MKNTKNTQNKKSLHIQKPTLGVCYYPEHWPENLWESDLDRMIEHGIEVIRIAEFAWSIFEPQEGAYNFDFFDRFMRLVKEKGLKVIFCTPTATPPAWLTHKYPEVLNAKQDGTLYRHGLRRHYNYNSPVYKEFTKKIVEAISSHYCPDSAVIGWQIDNELNCETDHFYSDSDHVAFRAYLKNKFETLENLNNCMGTTFWNQTYSSWDQLFLSRPTVNDGNNPHMALEEKRFISYSTIQFCSLQAEIINKYRREEQFITTNGIFGHLDSHEMTDSCLDFITYDSYPNFAYDTWTEPKRPGNLNDRRTSWSLTNARSISANFGIMQQQSGAGGWDYRMKQPAPKPGQMRLWTYQSLAHGADFISYFRWRTSWIGNEIYWHGLNDYSNLPNRRLKELKMIRDDFTKLHEIAGSHYQAQIALVKDYDNQWDGEQDKWHGPLDEFSNNGWFTATQLTHTPMDFYYFKKDTTLKDLQKYRLLVYPHATILSQKTATLLKAYVEQGGTLIMGSRTGYKDEYGRCPMRPMPGFAADICGVKVVDYTHLGPSDDEEYAVWEGETIPAPMFNDILEADDDSEILACFKGNYYDGEPALVSKRCGKGRAYYYGAGFCSETARFFLKKLGYASPYSDILELPEKAELTVRSGKNADYLFVLNYMPYSIEVEVKTPLTDLITGNTYNGKIQLPKYDVLIFRNKVECVQ